MPVTITSLQHKIISLQIVCRALRGGGRFTPPDIRRELGDDFRCQFALDGKDVRNLPVEAARPEMRAGLDINQLCRDAEPVTLAPGTAFDHVGNAQLFPQLPHIAILPAHGISGVACDNLKFGVPGKRRGYILRQTVCKV